MRTEAMSPALLRMPVVATILDVDLQRAYEMARTGLLPGVVRLGRQIRVDRQKLQQFIDSGGAPLPKGEGE